MRELFLTFVVNDDAKDRSLNILEKFCDMKSQIILQRQLLWVPLPKRMQKKEVTKKPGALAKLVETSNDPMKVLECHLNRLPYMLILQYDIKTEQYGTEVDCDETTATLIWTDIPIPGDSQQVNDRDRVQIEIKAEDHPCSKMNDLKYRYVGEIIKDGYRFVHGNISIDLVRTVQTSATAGSKNEQGNNVPKIVPDYDKIERQPESRYVMSAKIDVEDKKLIQQGKDELLALQKELQGSFNLKFQDRFLFDTRVRV
ncbi:mediator complex, subunit Med18 [Calycina marina]|uniref:Mediator of RNA polymerase II transcription subunit 18 n=1 Tax=Calycina marina TaxID=1763456 RepID=A0A9P7Z6M6_9HELO|nr:mediator complex, subunit Med18 [Calycina marina]